MQLFTFFPSPYELILKTIYLIDLINYNTSFFVVSLNDDL